MNYLMVVVALFFLNAVIFPFMLMKYFTNKQILPTLILSLAFLSGLIYLVETIVIIHKPINGSTLIQTKSNDVSIFYIFRQLSFICLTSLALFCYGKDNILDNNKKKTGILLLALIPFLVFPLLAHNLSSYNADYSLYVSITVRTTILRPGESTIQKYWFVCGHFYCSLLSCVHD